MNKKFIYLLVVAIAFLYACTKESQRIEYPSTGMYGRNILSIPNGDTISSSSFFSLAAELGKRADLKIVMTNLSGQISESPTIMWFYGEGNGWSVGEYDSNKQEFIPIKTGLIDLQMLFGGQGKCIIDLYENSKSITQSKILFWK
jgi:hypothetical protein